jgi:hypothetical protein
VGQTATTKSGSQGSRRSAPAARSLVVMGRWRVSAARASRRCYSSARRPRPAPEAQITSTRAKRPGAKAPKRKRGQEAKEAKAAPAACGRAAVGSWCADMGSGCPTPCAAEGDRGAWVGPTKQTRLAAPHRLGAPPRGRAPPPRPPTRPPPRCPARRRPQATNTCFRRKLQESYHGKDNSLELPDRRF